MRLLACSLGCLLLGCGYGLLNDRYWVYSVEKLPLKCGAAPDSVVSLSGDFMMMGERTVMQEALFYSFSIEDHVPADHLLRSIDRFVDLGGIRSICGPITATRGAPRSIQS
jgi:hypothetical protein